MVPRAILTKSGLVLVNTARQVNAAHTKTTVNAARPMSYLSKIAHSTVKRPIHKNTSFKNSNFNQRVNTVKDKNVNTVRPKAVVNAVRPKAVVNVASKCCDNGTELKNMEMNQFCERKADSKLPTTLWAEAVNTSCYGQNRVLVTKPHNKTPYELFLGRKATLGFVRPFGCPDTILNTIDHLGKFNGKVDEGFFVGNSKGIDQEKEDNVNSTNNVNAANTNEVNVICGKTSIELPDDPNMPPLKDIVHSDDDEDVGAEANMNNLDAFMPMDVKSAFLYGKIEEEGLCLSNTIDFRDPDFPNRVYKVEKALYGLHQAPRACFTDVKTASTPMETQKLLLKDEDGEEVDVHLYRSMIGSLMYLTSSRPDIMFAVCACARYQVNPKVSHLHTVKRIFRYLKGQPKLGLWYLKNSPFNLVAYTNSDYARASLESKSTVGGCQFFGCRLISWQCKKQTVVANFTTKAEYVAASS
ncbi:uncharacterized mitochondrial protein-like protein [Tanacetum coccineum]